MEFYKVLSHFTPATLSSMNSLFAEPRMVHHLKPSHSWSHDDYIEEEEEDDEGDEGGDGEGDGDKGGKGGDGIGKTTIQDRINAKNEIIKAKDEELAEAKARIEALEKAEKSRKQDKDIEEGKKDEVIAELREQVSTSESQIKELQKQVEAGNSFKTQLEEEAKKEYEAKLEAIKDEDKRKLVSDLLEGKSDLEKARLIDRTMEGFGITKAKNLGGDIQGGGTEGKTKRDQLETEVRDYRKRIQEGKHDRTKQLTPSEMAEYNRKSKELSELRQKEEEKKKAEGSTKDEELTIY